MHMQRGAGAAVMDNRTAMWVSWGKLMHERALFARKKTRRGSRTVQCCVRVELPSPRFSGGTSLALGGNGGVNLPRRAGLLTGRAPQSCFPPRPTVLRHTWQILHAWHVNVKSVEPPHPLAHRRVSTAAPPGVAG